MSLRYPAIPHPAPTDLRPTVVALKEAVEMLTAQSTPKVKSVATFQDLIDMGLIIADEVPE